MSKKSPWKPVPYMRNIRKNQSFHIHNSHNRPIAYIHAQPIRADTHRLVRYMQHYPIILVELQKLAKISQDPIVKDRIAKLVELINNPITPDNPV